MRKLLTAAVLAVFALSTPAVAEVKKEPAKKEQAKKAAPAKKKENDPKWKNNSLAKKQAECRADPTLPKCAKKKPQDKKK